MEFKLEWFEAITEAADMFEEFETLRPYSGRGMYGKECPSLRVDSLNGAFKLAAMAGLLQGQLEGDDLPSFDALEFARLMDWDSAGARSIILYWPRMELDAWPDQVAD